MMKKFVSALSLGFALFSLPLVNVQGAVEPVAPHVRLVNSSFEYVGSGLKEFQKMAETMPAPKMLNIPDSDLRPALERAFATELELKSATHYTKLAMPIAKEYQVDWKLVTAVMAVESNFNPSAESPVGARGLMQVMPETAAMFKVSAEDLYNPAENIKAGVQQLKRLKKRYPKDLKLVIAAYNAGEGNVTKHKGIPPFEETQNYVKKVLHHYKLIRNLA